MFFKAFCAARMFKSGVVPGKENAMLKVAFYPFLPPFMMILLGIVVQTQAAFT